MRRAPIALLCTAACAILLPAASSATPKIGGHDNGLSICDEQALHLYAQGAKQGLDVGRNRIDDGKLLSSGKVIPEPNPCQWRDKLDAMLNPPEPVTVSSPALVAPAPASTSVAPAPVSTGGCPSYMAGEASSPSAVNPSSGAAGCFQIIPSTQANYGCAAPDAACAAAICADVGASAWSASGADPCPYVQP